MEGTNDLRSPDYSLAETSAALESGLADSQAVIRPNPTVTRTNGRSGSWREIGRCDVVEQGQREISGFYDQTLAFELRTRVVGIEL